MSEIWKPIPNYEELYLISNQGRVKSLSTGKIRKPTLHKQGYIRLQLRKNNIPQNILVHRVVAEVFLGPSPSEIHTVNHKDGDKTNNTVNNLEWCTQGENNRHAYQVLKARSSTGIHNGHSKLTKEDVIEIRRLAKQGLTYAQIAPNFGVHQHHIGHIVRGDGWTHIE